MDALSELQRRNPTTCDTRSPPGRRSPNASATSLPNLARPLPTTTMRLMCRVERAVAPRHLYEEPRDSTSARVRTSTRCDATRYMILREFRMTHVFIVVGIRLYREGLAQLLTAQEGFTVVGTESDGRMAAAQIEHLTPDVALVEMGIRDLDVIAGALAARSPQIPLVALGIADSDTDVLACAEKGATAYVTREASVEELKTTIQRAANGELVCSPRTTGTLIRRLGMLAAELHPSTPTVRLTRREREVASLMREDLSNKEIATRLRIEVATVKNHVHNVLDKLQVHRRA
jgi:two-component system, NarL family, nitrate/nitrite response regulator NarL